MENKKNKIISISGEPVTGKGSNVNAIKQKLLEKGYTEENIHIISTGHDFRRYFNEIINFIKNLDNEKTLKELYEKEEIKEIMDSHKYRDLFIKAVSKLKKNNFDADITIEQANNLPELSEIRAILDDVIDSKVREMGMEIKKQERPNEIWIVDSRLAFKNIPESFAVRLTCRSDIAGKRLFEDKTRGKEDCNYKSLEDAIEQREKRKLGEVNRYKKAYGLDLTDENNYDLIIDTSFSTVDDISDTILNCLDRYVDGKFVPKNWASPKLMLPLQGERETFDKSMSGNDLSDMCKLISENGYNMSYPIEIIEVEGKKYIIEGHHRNFATASLDKTLIPYEVIKEPEYEKRAKYCRKINLFGHEGIFDRPGNIFSYNEIYPGIYNELVYDYGIR